MRKILFAATALILMSSGAQAEYRYRYSDGTTIATSCYRSIYASSGWMCRTWWNGTGNSSKSIRVPETMEFNTNANWGKATDDLPNGCRSCADVSK